MKIFTVFKIHQESEKFKALIKNISEYQTLNNKLAVNSECFSSIVLLSATWGKWD